MKTGEGKTLVAIMPSYLRALTGGRARRDGGDYLAIPVGHHEPRHHNFPRPDQRLHPGGSNAGWRREMYDCDITYGTE